MAPGKCCERPCGEALRFLEAQASNVTELHGIPCKDTVTGLSDAAAGKANHISLRDMLEERWKIWSSEKGFMVDA
jgi:hypothetical protein